jgi:hypothetical protein
VIIRQVWNGLDRQYKKEIKNIDILGLWINGNHSGYMSPEVNF